MQTTANGHDDSRPCAIIHPNGAVLFLPTYDQRFVQRLKRLIPPHARVFHGIQRCYVVVAPWDRKAVALAGEWFADLVTHHTPLPYDFCADDAHVALRRKPRSFGDRAAAIVAKREGGR